MSTDPDLLADFERLISQIREDPDCDGTLLGTGGFMDQQDRAMAAVRHLWAERFPSIPFHWRALRDFLASQGITPLQARRMRFEDIAVLLQEAPATNASGSTEATARKPAGGDKRTAGAKKKRSTTKGEGREKCIAALTQHHKYQGRSCLNTEPIGCNELARQADVSQSTASSFFKSQFKSHTAYKVVCRDAGRLADYLRLLNGEFSPHELYGRNPPNERFQDDND